MQHHFQPNFSKVEDCASGVVYCQIIDSIYPGAVPMAKVKMGAKTEVEFIHNFKVRRPRPAKGAAVARGARGARARPLTRAVLARSRSLCSLAPSADPAGGLQQEAHRPLH